MSILAHFDEEAGNLLLSGAEDISRYPLLMAFVRKHEASFGEQGEIVIPTKEGELATRYQTLERLLQRINLKLEVSGVAARSLKDAAEKSLQFEEFSKKASSIWNADIDTNEFADFIETVEINCPQRNFYRKQLLSAFHLAFSQNACNFSVPGAGKTSVVYAAFSYLKALPTENPKSVDRLLIVGPLSSFKAWEDEFVAIFGRNAESVRISGDMQPVDRTRFLRGISSKTKSTELILTSYQTLYNTVEDFQVFLSRSAPKTMVVLDEAHYIKGQEGEWAKAALSISPNARSRVVLTGTPAPNGYEDLSNLFRFLYPSRDILGFPVSSLRAMTDGAMSRAVPELKKRIQPFYTRIRKSDLNLPEAIGHPVEVPMGEEQTRIYRDLENRIVPSLKRQFDNPNMTVRVRARLIRLRQAAANPALLKRPLSLEDGIFDTDGSGDLNLSEVEVAERIWSFDENRNLERLRVCKELALSVLREQGKVLIWSYFLGNLDMLLSAFGPKADFVEVLTGATPVGGHEVDEAPGLGTREAIIDRFHSTSGKAVLIANPQAVGESISLHKACRSAIYFDRDFNAGRFIQSKDRIHRYQPEGGGQVNYYYLKVAGTVDDDIDARLITKERRLASLVDADDIPILTADESDANSEDIRSILESYERRKIQ